MTRWQIANAYMGRVPTINSGGESKGQGDVEQAVLGHGPNLGPYNEGRGLRLVRDPKFPIRITVQFYKATDNGVVPPKSGRTDTAVGMSGTTAQWRLWAFSQPTKSARSSIARMRSAL